MRQAENLLPVLSAATRSSGHGLGAKAIVIYVWAIVLFLVAFQSTHTYQAQVRDGHLGDFGRLYYGVLSWEQGGSLYAPTVATPEQVTTHLWVPMPNVAAPVLHALVWPLTVFRPGLAFLLWVLTNLTAWAVSLRICLREWNVRIAPPIAAVIALALVTSTVTVVSFETGQYAGLLMLAATLAWRAARHDDWATAGAWLGLLASQKPFVMLLIAWLLLHRRWRAVAAAVGVFGVMLAFGALVFGPRSYVEWVTALRGDVPSWGWLYFNASILAPWLRALLPSPVYDHLIHGTIAMMGIAGCALLIGAITLSRMRRTADLDLTWSILWAAALLLSPLGWTYYLWLGAGPFGGFIRHTWQHRPALRPFLLALGVCFVLPLWIVTLGQPSVVASFTIGSLFTWALLAFWLMAVSDSRVLMRP